MNDTLQCHRGEMYTAVSRKVGRLKSVKCTLQPWKVLWKNIPSGYSSLTSGFQRNLRKHLFNDEASWVRWIYLFITLLHSLFSFFLTNSCIHLRLQYMYCTYFCWTWLVALSLYLNYCIVSFVKDLLDGKNSEGMTPLFQATSCNNLECVQFLVTSGANIDARDNVGRTPVALAAYQVATSSNFSIFYILYCISPMIP